MKICHKLYIIFLGLFCVTCSEWDLDRVDFTQVITIGAIEVSSNSAFLIGDLENLRDSEVEESGFILSTDVSNTSQLLVDQPGVIHVVTTGIDTSLDDKAFAARATALNSSTEYIFRAYVKILGEDQVAYGQPRNFVTKELSVSLNGVERINQGCPVNVSVNIQLTGTLIGDNSKIRIIYSDNPNNREPTIENGIIEEVVPVDQTASIDVPLVLNCDQTYFIRASIGESEAIQYSEVSTFSTYQGGNWIPTKEFPEVLLSNLSGACPRGFSSKGYGFVAGTRADGASQVMWRYDKSSDIWEEQSSPAVSIGSREIFFGCSAPVLDFPRVIVQDGAVIEYFADNDSWVLLGESDGSFAAGLYPFMFQYMNQLFIGTGGTNLERSTVYRISLDRIGNALEMEDFPGTPRIRSSYFVIGDTGFAGLGQGEFFGSLYNDFWKFDLESESWSQAADFPGQMVSRVGITSRGKGYVLTGLDENESINPGFWEYDPLIDEWTKLADFGRGDGDAHVGFVLNGVIYGGLGNDMDGNPRQEFWRYIPELD